MSGGSRVLYTPDELDCLSAFLAPSTRYTLGCLLDTAEPDFIPVLLSLWNNYRNWCRVLLCFANGSVGC